MKIITKFLAAGAAPFGRAGAAGAAYLNRDRKSGYAGTIPRTPAEMAVWRELPDPKPSYREFVGLPEDQR